MNCSVWPARECYGSLSLEDALKGIQFDAGEYTGSVPLDVDGFEPTPDEPKSKFPVPGNDGLFLRLSHPVLPGRERRCFSGAGYGK